MADQRFNLLYFVPLFDLLALPSEAECDHYRHPPAERIVDKVENVKKVNEIDPSDSLKRYEPAPPEETALRLRYGQGEHQWGDLFLADSNTKTSDQQRGATQNSSNQKSASQDNSAQTGVIQHDQPDSQNSADSTHPDQPQPLVVLIHGGFWRNCYGAELMVPLAKDLAARGYMSWNIEYSRVGHNPGGFPQTLVDVAAGLDYLNTIAEQYNLDLNRIAVVGHSAGGHLAAWSGSRIYLEEGSTGANPGVQPKLAIGQGPVIDLEKGANEHLGKGAIVDFLGGMPEDVPNNYKTAQPRSQPSVCQTDQAKSSTNQLASQKGSKMASAKLTDTGLANTDTATESTPKGNNRANCSKQKTHFINICGKDDVDVPVQYSQHQNLDADLILLENCDHFDLINPNHAAWLTVIQAIEIHL